MTTDALDIRMALDELTAFAREYGGDHQARALAVLDAAPGWLVKVDGPRPAPFPRIELWAAGGERAEPTDAEEAADRARVRAWILERLGSGLEDQQRRQLEWALSEPEDDDEPIVGFEEWWSSLDDDARYVGDRDDLAEEVWQAAWEARGVEVKGLLAERNDALTLYRKEQAKYGQAELLRVEAVQKHDEAQAKVADLEQQLAKERTSANASEDDDDARLKWLDVRLSEVEAERDNLRLAIENREQMAHAMVERRKAAEARAEQAEAERDAQLEMAQQLARERVAEAAHRKRADDRAKQAWEASEAEASAAWDASWGSQEAIANRARAEATEAAARRVEALGASASFMSNEDPGARARICKDAARMLRASTHRKAPARDRDAIQGELCMLQGLISVACGYTEDGNPIAAGWTDVECVRYLGGAAKFMQSANRDAPATGRMFLEGVAEHADLFTPADFDRMLVDLGDEEAAGDRERLEDTTKPVDVDDILTTIGMTLMLCESLGVSADAVRATALSRGREYAGQHEPDLATEMPLVDSACERCGSEVCPGRDWPERCEI